MHTRLEQLCVPMYLSVRIDFPILFLQDVIMYRKKNGRYLVKTTENPVFSNLFSNNGLHLGYSNPLLDPHNTLEKLIYF